MKFLLAIVILSGVYLSLSYAQIGTLTTRTNYSTKNSSTQQEKMNQIYPPDSIYSPWPPFNRPRPGTIPSDPENQQNFPMPQPPLPSTPVPDRDCLTPGQQVRPENPNLLPCPNPPGTVPEINGIDPEIPTKADISK